MIHYIVHLYREMRLSYTGIEADTPQAAAELAGGKPTGDADNVEDCDGQDLSALVDVAGNEDYSQSVTVDFEPERIRKAAAKLLAASQALLTYAEREAESLFECWKRDGDLQIKDAAVCCERAIEDARAAIAEATTTGISPAPGDIDIDAVLAQRREIAVTWCVEDVQGIRPDLSEDECWEVLQQVKDVHDAEWGISWGTLETVATDLFGRAPATDTAKEA